MSAYGEDNGIKEFAGYVLFKANEKSFAPFLKGKSVTDKTTFEDEFNRAAILSGIACSVSPGASEEILKNSAFAKYISINFAAYDKLGNKKDNAIAKITGIKFESIPKLEEAFNKAVSDASGSGSGTGGGSGGGGSTGSSVSVSKFPNIKPPQKTEEIDVFDDLAEVQWAKEDIISLHKLGAVNGKEERIFAPNSFVRREEFIKMVIEAFSIKSDNTQNSFNDVDSAAWYSEYINIGVGSGIINGINDDTFGVGENITREQIAAVVARVIGAEQFMPGDVVVIDKNNAGEIRRMRKVFDIKSMRLVESDGTTEAANPSGEYSSKNRWAFGNVYCVSDNVMRLEASYGDIPPNPVMGQNITVENHYLPLFNVVKFNRERNILTKISYNEIPNYLSNGEASKAFVSTMWGDGQLIVIYE